MCVQVIESAHVAGLNTKEHDPAAEKPNVGDHKKAQKDQNGSLFDQSGGEQQC